MTSWAERERDDAGLHAFVQARQGQVAVALAALKVAHQQALDTIQDQQQTIAMLRQHVKGKGK